jgi:antirestriction protein ArdC
VSKVYQIVTDRIIKALDAGVVPWRKSWRSGVGIDSGWPVSLSTSKAYRGINAVMLSGMVTGYSSPWWGTFKQIQERGGKVNKGEKASLATFWKLNKVKDQSGIVKTIPILLYYNVFNIDQCSGVEMPKAKALREFVPIDRCESVVGSYVQRTGVKIRDDGNGRAFYRDSTDSIHMPKAGAFKTNEDWYATLMHELAHSTGAATRLARDLSGGFGSKSYAREELCAEIASSFLCAELGIDTPGIQGNEAAYIDGWRKVLKEDERCVVVAAGAAQRAADLILGRTDAKAEAEEGAEEEAEATPTPTPVVVVPTPTPEPVVKVKVRKPKGLPKLVGEGFNKPKAEPTAVPAGLWG